MKIVPPPVSFSTGRGLDEEPKADDDKMSDSEAECCGCHGDEKRAASDPAYRRALWIVVILNLGFGVVEIIGGFIARSQALKADLLDFLGDGSITLVGLLVLSWAQRTRARSAGAGLVPDSAWSRRHYDGRSARDECAAFQLSKALPLFSLPL